jgi:hypothetical protein
VTFPARGAAEPGESGARAHASREEAPPVLTVIMDGLGPGQGEVTVTLSKVDVLMVPAVCEHTNSPIVMGSVRVTVVVPTWVQVVPSGDEYAVMVVPERVSLSQAGKV